MESASAPTLEAPTPLPSSGTKMGEPASPALEMALIWPRSPSLALSSLTSTGSPDGRNAIFQNVGSPRIVSPW